MAEAATLGVLFAITLSCAMIHGLLKWWLRPALPSKERGAGFAPILLVILMGVYGILNPEKVESVSIVFLGIGVGLLLSSISLVMRRPRSGA